VGVVEEPIEDGIGDGRLTDAGVPLVDRKLAGNDGRAGAMAIVHDLEQVIALLFLGGAGAPVVDDQYVDTLEAGEQSGVSAVGARGGGSRSSPLRRIESTWRYERARAAWARAQACSSRAVP